MSGTSPLYGPQASPRLYQQSGAELDADPPVWHPALEYSQPLSMANQNYNWTIKSEDTGSLETFHQQSVRFRSVRLPALSPVPLPPFVAFLTRPLTSRSLRLLATSMPDISSLSLSHALQKWSTLLRLIQCIATISKWSPGLYRVNTSTSTFHTLEHT